ncbi:hypothetical protein [Tunicatimonas pelagia]|uniref:hypothetical protein n=1 Tax=Tunicatimonas pelagia TaxID=931531 RepID=UPI002666E808|nr:hypothetical protein [Tunicatimonas pelagia]WKN41546.1 hypothetical protein P0M28_21150 [Tunicatimonas pelagia]
MNKIIFTLLAVIGLAVFSSDVSAQFIRSIYTSPDFEQLAKDHKTLAIIPFDATVKLRPKQMKDMSADDLARMEEQEGESVQSALYSYFLRRKSKHNFRVDFQDVTRTNALLAKNGIAYDVLGEYTSEDLAEILEVDGIISGLLVTDKPMSDAGAVAVGVLFGISTATNSGKVAVNINDGATGELLWKYEKALSRELGSDTNQIINALMRKASRKFPYIDK